jgi:hypothetical protein
MALSATEKKEIEVLIRKEIKDFLSSNTLRQFEDKMIDLVAKEIKRGKVGTEVKDLVAKMFSEFYQFMWTQRSYWEPRLKNVR